jgi:cytidine deaminase
MRGAFMEIRQKLFEAADKVRNNAYAPYSKYQVGAAIYGNDGNIYTGTNVENVSYPCGTCAEAGAIAAMIASGTRKIKAILIISEGNELVYPCGACLQKIAEFSDENTKVYLANLQGIQEEYGVKDLLPHNFVAKELKK